jgi:hypothetical protein
MFAVQFASLADCWCAVCVPDALSSCNHPKENDDVSPPITCRPWPALCGLTIFLFTFPNRIIRVFKFLPAR